MTGNSHEILNRNSDNRGGLGGVAITILLNMSGFVGMVFLRFTEGNNTKRDI